MQVLVAFASFVVQRSKALYNLPRPNELSPRIQPMIPTPGYSTYPSGHATEAHLVSVALKALVGTTKSSDLAAMLNALAERIARNREVAGLHFEKDSEAGKRLGIALFDKHLKGADKNVQTQHRVE